MNSKVQDQNGAREKRNKSIRWMKYLVSCIIVGLLFLLAVGCENTRHSVGVTAKPFAKGDKMEDSVKFNYKMKSLDVSAKVKEVLTINGA